MREIYCSDDYAGIDIGNRRAYFGYEHTKCLEHGTIDSEQDEECAECDLEWCFVVWDKNEKELCRFTQSELGEGTDLTSEETYAFLCLGLAKYLGL